MLGCPNSLACRLCCGPTAPIWDYVTRHVRNQRNVKKIRGNLRLPFWLGRASRGRCRAWGTPLRAHRKRRSASLWLLGAELGPAGLQDGHEGALRAIHKRPGKSRAELSAILAAEVEPEVLVSIKALCKAREAELQRPRPHRAASHPRKAQEALDWSEQAEAVLIGHSPEAVLWALEVLASQSTRALLAGPARSAEAPPILKNLLQVRGEGNGVGVKILDFGPFWGS
ncbi:HAUS augmin-like complex subunit 5 [Ammospiza nelsoni]|uniref:HAUS augmin-like complex subunit 5 n=1 Tax=Ammospiza nelsoni TaxID=2857394 RepID=UPI00286A9FF2|nr:HAUS augmin-like complex subunit 5 [Ammospiza nelsoni]